MCRISIYVVESSRQNERSGLDAGWTSLLGLRRPWPGASRRNGLCCCLGFSFNIWESHKTTQIRDRTNWNRCASLARDSFDYGHSSIGTTWHKSQKLDRFLVTLAYGTLLDTKSNLITGSSVHKWPVTARHTQLNANCDNAWHRQCFDFGPTAIDWCRRAFSGSLRDEM
jgi:hypothetical protein